MTTDFSSATAPATPGPGSRVRTPGALWELYRLVLSHLLTRGRLVLFGLILTLCVGLGWMLTRVADFQQRQATLDVVALLGMGLIVPVVALVMGSAALGTWTDDETLVYVWLRPVARWKIALAATAAAATVAIPVAMLPITAMTAMAAGNFDSGFFANGAGDGTLAPYRDVVVATAAASGLAALAYTAVFTTLGLVIRRALLWGLVYTFIWEFFVARAGAGAARLSINNYAASILSRMADYEIPQAERAISTSLFTLVAVTVVAVAVTTWRLHRANVA
jgi:ABC-2 type transport system permease protein